MSAPERTPFQQPAISDSQACHLRTLFLGSSSIEQEALRAVFQSEVVFLQEKASKKELLAHNIENFGMPVSDVDYLPEYARGEAAAYADAAERLALIASNLMACVEPTTD